MGKTEQLYFECREIVGFTYQERVGWVGSTVGVLAAQRSCTAQNANRHKHVARGERRNDRGNTDVGPVEKHCPFSSFA